MPQQFIGDITFSVRRSFRAPRRRQTTAASGRVNEAFSVYPDDVSPTVLRVRGFRFYFFSREEPRMHVHVSHANGEAKFWLEPTVELAASYGLSASRVNEASKLIEEHFDEIRSAWAKHFPG
jgi:hypothetical protein